MLDSLAAPENAYCPWPITLIPGPKTTSYIEQSLNERVPILEQFHPV